MPAKDEESPSKRMSRNSCHLTTDNLQEFPIAIAQEDKKKQCINLDKYFPSSEDIGSKENQSPVNSSKDRHAPPPPVPLNRLKSTEKPAEKPSDDIIENSMEKTGVKSVPTSKTEEKSVGVKTAEKFDADKTTTDEKENKDGKVGTAKPEEPTAPPMKPKPIPRTKGL